MGISCKPKGAGCAHPKGSHRSIIGIGGRVLVVPPSNGRNGSTKLANGKWVMVDGWLNFATLSDVTRSRTDLIVENALLRQQLIVLRRQVKRPQLTRVDRIRLVLLARCTRFWLQALHIVQPDTLLRWHRDLFRRYWRRKLQKKKRKPRITPETISLIKQMARENRLWGAERIRGELLKLGIKSFDHRTPHAPDRACSRDSLSE
jgi:hypothetical protein